MTTPENVTFVNAVIEELQGHLATLHKLVQKRVLPNSRYPLIRELDAVNTLCEQVKELLQRSGMDRRLGFLREGETVQPVMLDRVNDPDATKQEGSGLQDGQH